MGCSLYRSSPSRRNSVKGIEQGTYQYNQFSKKRKFSLKGKMNSPEDEFVPLREKGVERTTSPRGRFTAPRGNDTGRFRECSLRKRAFFSRGKLTPLNDKVVGKVIVPRERANDRCPRGGFGDRVVPLSK